MFETTHRSLTKYYVIVTVALFIIMVACFLALMTWTIYSDEKFEASAFAREEAVEYFHVLEKNIFNIDEITPAVIDDGELSDEEISNALRMFSFLQLPDGRIYPLTLMSKSIEAWSREQIKQRDFSKQLILTYRAKDEGRHRVFFAKEDIVKDGVKYGTIYAGKDVTIIWSILKKMTIFAILLITGFTILLFFYGKKFAQKAMIPVEEAILKQKQFITDASHELRTPLSVILAGTELVRTDETQELSEQNKKILLDTQAEIRKMSQFVDNLLNLAKIDEGNIDLLREVNVSKVAILTVEKLRPLASKKNIRLSLANTEPILWYTNNELLAQVLYILLDNAIKYTPEGGQILVGLKIDAKGDRKLLLSVEDTGMGIAEQGQKRIFERFYRVDKARSRKEGGSGLGLPIAWGLLKNQGGTIEVTSTLGKGSLFKVTLPEISR